jgi:hypothetical protein
MADNTKRRGRPSDEELEALRDRLTAMIKDTKQLIRQTHSVMRDIRKRSSESTSQGRRTPRRKR